MLLTSQATPPNNNVIPIKKGIFPKRIKGITIIPISKPVIILLFIVLPPT